MITDKKPNNRQLLMTYLGFAFRMMALLAVAIWVGLWGDKRINLQMPLLVFLLPLFVIIVVLIKVIKDTSGKQKDVN